MSQKFSPKPRLPRPTARSRRPVTQEPELGGSALARREQHRASAQSPSQGPWKLGSFKAKVLTEIGFLPGPFHRVQRRKGQGLGFAPSPRAKAGEAEPGRQAEVEASY